MVPLTGFEGVRAKVTTNMGTFTAWFPIMNHCPIGDSRWWQVLLEVKKHTSSTLTANLSVTSSSVPESRAHQHKGLTSIQLGGVVVAVIVVIVMMMVVVLLIIRRRAQRENEQGSQLTHSIQEVNVSRNSLYESFDQYQQHSSGPGQGDGPADTQC
ncbi:hypothetical protein O3P69_006999 [Scylla paramamosain]|uniref:Uncharacterized protein n=1 Tax=Scylla paramamosain TaxID=85552 RepID=A0AAW0V3D5_SCYPA